MFLKLNAFSSNFKYLYLKLKRLVYIFKYEGKKLKSLASILKNGDKMTKGLINSNSLPFSSLKNIKKKSSNFAMASNPKSFQGREKGKASSEDARGDGKGSPQTGENPHSVAWEDPVNIFLPSDNGSWSAGKSPADLHTDYQMKIGYRQLPDKHFKLLKIK